MAERTFRFVTRQGHIIDFIVNADPAQPSIPYGNVMVEGQLFGDPQYLSRADAESLIDHLVQLGADDVSGPKVREWVRPQPEPKGIVAGTEAVEGKDPTDARRVPIYSSPPMGWYPERDDLQRGPRGWIEDLNLIDLGLRIGICRHISIRRTFSIPQVQVAAAALAAVFILALTLPLHPVIEGGSFILFLIVLMGVVRLRATEWWGGKGFPGK